MSTLRETEVGRRQKAKVMQECGSGHIYNDNEDNNGHNDQRVYSDDGKHDYHHGDEEQGVNDVMMQMQMMTGISVNVTGDDGNDLNE